MLTLVLSETRDTKLPDSIKVILDRWKERLKDIERYICSILSGILTLVLPKPRDNKLPNSIKVILDRRKERLKEGEIEREIYLQFLGRDTGPRPS